MQIRILILMLAIIGLAPLAASAVPAPPPPAVKAKGHLLVDMHSGQALASNNPQARLEPASLTKIMTAYVVFRELAEGHITLADEVVISERAWRMEGSRMFIEVGRRVSVEDLLKGLIVQSGNDAAVALAEHTAGSEDAFAAMMNEHSRRLGMNSSHFVNSSGLPHEDHYTTPADIVLVTIATIREFPEWYAWYAIREFAFNGITQPNRNNLLWRDDSVDGVKTGHTQGAGYCLVASAKQEDMRLVSVIMGTDSESTRLTESQKLLTYGFRFFDSQRLYDPSQTVEQIRVWKGQQKQVPVGVARDLYVAIPRDAGKTLSARLNLSGVVEAPVQRGQTVGSIEVLVGDEVIKTAPAVALADVEKAGIFGQLLDSALLMLE
ncbi:MAG: D-alanyl-D-alanine carboxypeptidase family protein [Pseudomonadota bacterium]